MFNVEMPQPEQTTKYCQELSQWLFDNFWRGDVLLVTIHGSYLYGTAHSESDVDCYVVTLNGSNKHKEYELSNGMTLDVRQNNLERFVELLGSGAHQAVEAFFSPYAVWGTDSPWYPYLRAQKVGLGGFAKKCLSASSAFHRRASEELEKSDKFLRHAERLEHGVIHALDNNGEYSPVWREM